MSDKQKESSPPPLLLMGATEGLTLTPATGASLLMPIPQAGTPLFAADEGGEEDSFVGQGPMQSSMQSSLFQPTASASDPFAQVGHNPLPSVPVSTSAPLFSRPPASNTPPIPRDGSPNPMRGGPDSGSAPPSGPPTNSFHRPPGPMRYAQPPPGTYAPPIPGSQTGSQMPAPGPLPTFSSAPSMSMPPPPPPTFGAPPTSTFPPPTSAPSSSSSAGSFAPIPFGGGGLPSSASSPNQPSTSFSPVTPPHASSSSPTMPYIPVSYHWFYCTNIELRQVWVPFTIADTIKLEDAFRSGAEDAVVSVEGGRYDVTLSARRREAVYWEEPATTVRRCSWFCKPDGDTRFVPYEEDFADKLEAAYRDTLATSAWHKKLEFPGGETIVMHNPQVIVHFRSSDMPDEWGTTQSDAHRPKVVKRGVDETFDNIEDGEANQIDHLVFFVHGIGPTCDLRFRNLTECVDDFRRVAQSMMSSHFKHALDAERVGRVEFLPVKWRKALHGDASGVDRKLKAITLNSIGKLRNFTNDTLLDVLFYASPVYAQKIANTVTEEMNRLHALFLSRNPNFKGAVSVAGHSLGSLILFDLLAHQKDPSAPEEPEQDPKPTPNASNLSLSTLGGTETPNSEGDTMSESEPSLEDLLQKMGLQDYLENFQKEQIDMEALAMCEDSDIKEMGIPMGPRKKLQGYVKELKQKQAKKERQAVEQQQKQQQMEIQKRLQEEALKEQSNTLKPRHDPLLRSVSNTSVNFVAGGHGTGLPLVSYPQLDFAPAHFFALGSPIAMCLTVRGVDNLGEEFRLPTCPQFFNIFHPFDPVAYRLEPLITAHYPPKPIQIPHHKGRKRLHLELKENLARMGTDIKQKIIDSVKYTWKAVHEFAAAHRSAPTPGQMEEEVDSVLNQMAATTPEKDDDLASMTSSIQEEEIPIGNLNNSRRIDYVLQEAPIESFNDYLFALGSHLCYWESEDTALLILREVYSLLNVRPQKPGQMAPPPHMGPPLVSPPGAAVSSIAPPPPMSSSAPPPMFMPPSSSAPPPMAPPPMGPPSSFGSTPSRGHPTSRPKRVVDQSIYGGGSPQQSTMPTVNPGPPPMTGFRPQ